MKIDPGMHIGMHLVFFGKAGVTTYLLGMAVSLVGGDLGVPMSHKPPSEV
jgi:hypothetical protein